MESPLPFITAAADDLIVLREQWGENVTNRTLRATSAMLRRLIVDDHLIRALKHVNPQGSPRVSVPDLERSLAHVDTTKIVFATFGRAKVKGGDMSGFFAASYALSPDVIAKIGGDPRFPIDLTLPEFKDATGMIVRGRRIPNRQIIQYVANKLGGAHFDPKRIGTDGEIMSLLDETTHHELLGKPAVYFQLLSIGQALTNNRELMRFADEFGSPD